jgi:hypothetical protein
VTCTATDGSGNHTSDSFTITVIGAAGLLEQLRTDTIGLVTNSTAERALITTVDQAIAAERAGNTWAVYTALLKYVVQIDRYVDSRGVSPAAAQHLLTTARHSLDAIM